MVGFALLMLSPARIAAYALVSAEIPICQVVFQSVIYILFSAWTEIIRRIARGESWQIKKEMVAAPYPVL